MVANGVPSSSHMQTAEFDGDGIKTIFRDNMSSFEEFRRRKLFEAIEGLDLFLIKDLLSRSEEFGEGWDYRDGNGRSVYAHAITIGVTRIVAVFIEHGIPLGDALLRAADRGVLDVVAEICGHAAKLPRGERQAVVECRCENDDYHPCTTPLMAAASKANFKIVKLLLASGAMLSDPNVDGGAIDFEDAEVAIMKFRAQASEAYMVQAFSDPVDFAFGLGRRLRDLGDRWEDQSETLYGLAEQVGQFSGDFVGQASSLKEVRSIMRFSRDTKATRNPVGKIQLAVEAGQKTFVVHPFTQLALKDTFYEGRDVQGSLLSLLLVTLVASCCYPLLSLWYLIYPPRFLLRFLQVPHTRLYMKVGSDVTLLACVTALVFVEYSTHPITTFALEATVFIFCVGVSAGHAKYIFIHGAKRFFQFPLSLADTFMVKMCYIALYIGWMGRLLDAYQTMAIGRFNAAMEELHSGDATNVNATFYTTSGTIANLLNDSQTTFPGVRPSVAESSDLPTWLMAEWNNPRVIAHALYALVAFVCVLRTFYVLSINQVGIFVVAESVMGMASDVARLSCFYLVIALAFAVGITHSLYYASRSAVEACRNQGSTHAECMTTHVPTIPVIFLELYWSLYGLITPRWLFVQRGSSYVLYLPSIIFMFFTIAAIIVLLNLLIAVMSARYEAVQLNADREWKFSRAKLWLNFIMDEDVLPPPFNIMPSLDRIRRCVMCCTDYKETQKEQEETEKKWARQATLTSHKECKDVTRVMAERFVKSRQKSKGGSEEAPDSFGRSDLLALRNDWVELRQRVKEATHKIEITLEYITNKTSRWKLGLDVLPTIDQRIDADSKDVDEMLQMTVPEVARKLQVVGQLIDDVHLALSEPERPEPRKVKEAVVESSVEVEVEVEVELATKTEVQLKSEMVKLMAELFGRGMRPQDDERYVRIAAEYRRRYADSTTASSNAEGI